MAYEPTIKAKQIEVGLKKPQQEQKQEPKKVVINMPDDWGGIDVDLQIKLTPKEIHEALESVIGGVEEENKTGFKMGWAAFEKYIETKSQVEAIARFKKLLADEQEGE